MALLLSVETSTHTFSCALHQDQKQVAFRVGLKEQSASSLLTIMIEEMFANSAFNKRQLDAIVVASGPGSFTGLRIGVATAKGICYALGIPLISVNTLHLLARQFIDDFSESNDMENVLFCPMLDARRMEVYCMLCDYQMKEIEPVQAKIIDENSFAERLEARVIYFFGEGSNKCKDAIGHPNARFVFGYRPLASLLGEIGFYKYLNKEVENINLFEPYYLKDFVIKKPKIIS